MSLVLVTSENDFTTCGCRAKTSYKVKIMASEPCVEQPGLSWEGWRSLGLPSTFSSQELGSISPALGSDLASLNTQTHYRPLWALYWLNINQIGSIISRFGNLSAAVVCFMESVLMPLCISFSHILLSGDFMFLSSPRVCARLPDLVLGTSEIKGEATSGCQE